MHIMATKIIGQGTVAPILRQQKSIRTFDLSGTSIRKVEETDFDIYKGPLNEMVAVGIVRSEQLPPPGKKQITWSHGQRVFKNCRRDEGYLCVVLYWAPAEVRLGVPVEVRKARRAEVMRSENAKRRAEEQEKLDAKAQIARKGLESVLRSEDAFKRHLVRLFKDLAPLALNLSRESRSWHAYALSEKATEEIWMSFDAVVEAVMQAKVDFDPARHESILNGYQEVIRAADPAFYAQLDKLTLSNSTILEGEQA
jgi:hypothetical protein